jgi:DNA-binding protein HU-beta
VTKAEIIDLIAKGTGLTKVETSAVVEGFLSTIEYALQKGQRVEIRGFGTFCLRERREKRVANPKTGKVMHIPHRIVPDFKPSPQLKEAVIKGLKEGGKYLPDAQQDQEQTDIFTELDRYFIEE